MKSLMARLRSLARSAGPPPPLQIRRATYTIEVRDAARAYLTLETRWQSLVDGLTGYRQSDPTGAGRIHRLRASVGLARSLTPDEAGQASGAGPSGGPAAGQALYQIELPAPVPARREAIQFLSASLIDAFSADSPTLIIRPLYPTEAIGLAIVFPLTRPPRAIALLRTDGRAPEPNPTALQATPRADGRLAYVWLKEAPPPGAVYGLTWQW